MKRSLLKMGLYCILCGKKDKSVSYIRFPSNKHIRKQWLKFCKRSEKNLYDSHRLCTDHFKSEDLRKLTRCTVVRPEAVPCIYSTHVSTVGSTNNINICPINNGNICPINNGNICPINVSNLKTEDIDIVNESLFTIENTHTDIVKKEIKIEDDKINVNPTYGTGIDNCEILQNNCLTPSKRRCSWKEDAHCSSKITNLDCNSTKLVSNDGIDSTIPIQKPVSTFTPANCDSTLSMIPDPRYVGDIQLSHMATPGQATRTLNVVRRTVMQQRQKIETLQKKFNRCKQRVSSLKDLVSELKKRNHISETVAHLLMVRLSSIYRSMQAPNKTAMSSRKASSKSNIRNST